MHFLIIEDEPKVASFIKKGLEELSYTTDVAYEGPLGLKMATSNKYDAIILDINLPIINGFEVCRGIREENINTPILMLTALGATDDKLEGFDAGADDYLVKPFEFKELVARIKALTKRHTGAENSAVTFLKVADLEMNLETKIVRRAGKKIDLTAKEFSLLEFLLRNKGKSVSRAAIAEKVWDVTFDTGTNVIDVYVNFLRKKIDKDFKPRLIHTQVGMGYILWEDEEN
jgi:two-component system, OmpR family, copper resistance phosphate regulon response regulator CusR